MEVYGNVYVSFDSVIAFVADSNSVEENTTVGNRILYALLESIQKVCGNMQAG